MSVSVSTEVNLYECKNCGINFGVAKLVAELRGNIVCPGCTRNPFAVGSSSMRERLDDNVREAEELYERLLAKGKTISALRGAITKLKGRNKS